MISVALIEDNRLVREGILALLSHHPDFTVVAAEQRKDALTDQPIVLDQRYGNHCATSRLRE